MLCNQKCKVRIVRPLLHILIAVPVYRDNAVRVLIYHNSVRVHAEGSHIVLELLCPIDNLALVQFIRQMGKDNRRKLYPDADIDSV